MADAGRKPIEIDLKLFGQAAGLMGPLDEIADHFGVSRDTIERRLKIPEYAEAYARARADRKMWLRQKQFASAEKGSDSMQKWLGQDILGQSDKRKVEHSGDPDKPLSLKDLTLEELLKKTRDGSSDDTAAE